MAVEALAPVVSRLPEPVQRRGIDEAQWLTLRHSLYPGAAELSVLLVWDYCVARKLDPLKKPCHIVPMKVRNKDGEYEWRDVVMPGIYEYRTTAQRTGQYLGHSQPEYGPDVEQFGVTVPEWCALTVYRWNPEAQQRVEFPVRTYFREVVALKNNKANQRWAQAPIQMLTKCCEAAALREGFPDCFGGEHTAEEMDGQAPIANGKDTHAPRATELEKPDGYDIWKSALEDVASDGEQALADAWEQSAVTHRAYLAATQPTLLKELQATAKAVPDGEAES